MENPKLKKGELNPKKVWPKKREKRGFFKKFGLEEPTGRKFLEIKVQPFQV